MLLGKQILFPQQCFHGWANRETFEETSRIANVSATMFPSLPRALRFRLEHKGLDGGGGEGGGGVGLWSSLKRNIYMCSMMQANCVSIITS